MTPLQKFMQDLLGMIDLISKDKNTVSPIEKARILNASIKLGNDLDSVKEYLKEAANSPESYNELILQLGDLLITSLMKVKE